MTFSSWRLDVWDPTWVAGEQRIADPDGVRSRCESFDELILDGDVDERARCGHARLSGGREDAVRGALHRSRKVGVPEDDVRRLTSELECRRSEALTRGCRDRTPSGRRPRERDLVDVGMRDERLPDPRAKARKDVEHTVGKVELLDHRHEGQAETGVSSAGLSTTVFPAASAGQTFQAIIVIGEFHGMMAATTPIGSRRV